MGGGGSSLTRSSTLPSLTATDSRVCASRVKEEKEEEGEEEEEDDGGGETHGERRATRSCVFGILGWCTQGPPLELVTGSHCPSL
jgi:hypothetical protein